MSLQESGRRACVNLSGYALWDGLEYEERSGPSGKETCDTSAERLRTRGDAYAPNEVLLHQERVQASAIDARMPILRRVPDEKEVWCAD